MSTSCSSEGKGRYGSFRLRMKRRVRVQVNLCYLLTMRAVPERLRDVSCRDATTFAFTCSKYDMSISVFVIVHIINILLIIMEWRAWLFPRHSAGRNDRPHSDKLYGGQS